MAIPKEELHSLLKFDPGWFTDPVPWPWLINYLEKEHIYQIARIQLDFQKSLNAARGKALEQLDAVLKSAGK